VNWRATELCVITFNENTNVILIKDSKLNSYSSRSLFTYFRKHAMFRNALHCFDNENLSRLKMHQYTKNDRYVILNLSNTLET